MSQRMLKDNCGFVFHMTSFTLLKNHIKVKREHERTVNKVQNTIHSDLLNRFKFDSKVKLQNKYLFFLLSNSDSSNGPDIKVSGLKVYVETR